MKLNDAQNTFAVRLYDWSLRDFLREMDEGCPLLSLVGPHDRFVAAFVTWVKTMPISERKSLAKGLIRRAHGNAAALRGEALNEHQQKQLNMEVYQQVSIREQPWPPYIAADKQVPDQCSDILSSSLSPVLGNPVRLKSGVRATRKVGDWKLITEFTFYRRDRSLHFEYQFVRKDGTRWIGHGGPFPRSLFWFYGVSVTRVNVTSQEDSEPMAKAMAKLAEHFVVQADPLFTGLGIND